MRIYHFRPIHYTLLAALFLCVSLFGMTQRFYLTEFLQMPLYFTAVFSALVIFYFTTRPLCPSKHALHLTMVLTFVIIALDTVMFLLFPKTFNIRKYFYSAAWVLLTYPSLFIYGLFRP